MKQTENPTQAELDTLAERLDPLVEHMLVSSEQDTAALFERIERLLAAEAEQGHRDARPAA